MATSSSEATETNGIYRIHDYFSPSDPVNDFPDRDKWKEAIKKRLEQMMVVDWKHYTTPLLTIKNIFDVIG